MRTQRVKFKNRDGVELSARLDFPLDQIPHHTALFAHCFTCNKDLNAVKNISRALTSEGFAVLRFDFTGLGESEGEFAESNFSANVQDLIDACVYLTAELKAPELIIGHSLGGAAVVFAANQMPDVKAVVTIGAPADPAHVSHLFEDQLEGADNNENVEVSIGGRAFKMQRQFLEDVRTKDMRTEVAALRRGLLILHSPQDTIVSVDNAAAIYQAAMHPKSFVSLDGADHLLSNKKDSLYVGSLIASWATRYLEFPVESNLSTTKQIVVRTGLEGFTSQVKAGTHRLLADEPVSVGGQDFGPSPYEFVSVGLGACTGMTLRMYANRKEWPLEEVRVHVDHAKEEVEDAAGTNKVDVFKRTIELRGDLDQDQRERLLQIANKCPVHRTLEGAIAITTELLE